MPCSIWARTYVGCVSAQLFVPHFSSGTNSGTISASNIEPPQVGISFMPRYW